MNRLTNDTFQQSREKFVPYIMSSFPDYDSSIDIALSLEKAGADALEWGVPFSDPLADGPVIQKAGEAARRAGGGLKTAIAGAKEARERGLAIPMVLFTYVNPVLSLGYEQVLDRMQDAEMDGILIPDLPHEEAAELRTRCRDRGISLINLVAPTSKSRMKEIAGLGDGFLYYVTSLGVTGTRENFNKDLEQSIQELKQASHVPVLAGFGISKAEHVQYFQQIADGVIVGSALVQFITDRSSALLSDQREQALEEIEDFVRELTEGGQPV
ncbi:tryptophan synthase subunit alpha [Alkalicoccus chagannorensis]|uniref:tryptophan synthase subunit alpha n=1 Tax=Alkalicoccus chagannorensis TaxID=427072 RepID=UPI000400BD06|nr:tryptophan synthase subunit alpha [Alkalicoccus chagannorensis]